MCERAPILTTERLVLRNFCKNDLDELFDYRNDARSNQFQRGQLRARDDLEALIARRANDALDGVHSGQFAIALRSDDTLIGEITVLIDENAVSLGYTLSYKHHRNGYATEILAALIARLRALNPKCAFTAQIEPKNVASIALVEKLGFHKAGVDEQEGCVVFTL